MSLGNSFAYFNNMYFGGGYSNYYSPFFGSGYYNSWACPFSYGMNYSNFFSPISIFGYNNFSFSPSVGFSGYSSNWNYGYDYLTTPLYNYSPSGVGNYFNCQMGGSSNSLYSQFLSITSKSRTTAREKMDNSSSPITTRTYSGVGNAKTVEAYVTNNKKLNAGKLKGLSNFKDITGRVEMCNPEIIDTLIDLAKEAQKYGYTFVVTSSFRTYEEQVALVGSKGLFGKRNGNGRVGVAAAAGTSPHEFGQAVDFAIYKGKTKISISQSNTPWVLSCLKNHSMTWGGNYSSVREPWHFNTNNARTYRTSLKQNRSFRV